MGAFLSRGGACKLPLCWGLRPCAGMPVCWDVVCHMSARRQPACTAELLSPSSWPTLLYSLLASQLTAACSSNLQASRLTMKMRTAFGAWGCAGIFLCPCGHGAVLDAHGTHAAVRWEHLCANLARASTTRLAAAAWLQVPIIANLLCRASSPAGWSRPWTTTR